MNDEALQRAFWLEGFADYLALEAGSSRHTVEAYLRDVRRLALYAVTYRAERPEAVTPRLVRDFVYHLKDIGLASSSIRRPISAIRT